MSDAKAVAAPQAPATTRPARRESEGGRLVRTLNQALRGSRNVFLLATFWLVAEAATSIAAKYPIAYLIDYLLGAQPDLLPAQAAASGLAPRTATLAVLTAGIVGIALLNSLSDSLAEIELARGGRLLGFNLRNTLYGHLQKLSLAFYSKQRTGDLLTRVTGDVTALEEFAIKSLKDIAGSIFLLALSVGTLLVISWQIALVTVVTLPVLALISNQFADRIKGAAKQQRAREGELAAVAQEMLTSIRVIQTYGSAGGEQRRFAEQSQRTMQVALLAARLQAWFSGVINVLQAVTIVLVVWIGVWLLDGTLLSVGTLVFCIGLIQDLFKPTKRIIKEWNAVGKIFASIERIHEVLDRRPAVQNEPGAAEAPPFVGRIEYRHVSFAYQPEGEAEEPPRLALRDVSFSIAPGEVVALVGGSGAGKSTIAQLLPRLYDPHLGQILIDGQDIRGFTLDSLRSGMSMVLQETILFTGTVAENIAYGRAEATRQEVIAAAIQANAHDFIEALPQGYDTPLSERAANLSGGQRQRIAIARAFIRNSPILILDEPTTGLDAESSDMVLLALRTLMKDKSTLIISHDLNLIRHASRILVIKGGAIDQIGTHKELLKLGGLYAELYHKQFGRAMDEQGARPAAAPPAAAHDDDEEPAPRRAFQTLISHALPAPVSRQAFETTLLRAVAGPEPPAAPAPEPAPPPPPPPARQAPPTTLLRVEPEALAAPPAAGPAAEARRNGAPLGADQLDPAASPALREALPGLEAALEPAVMHDFLQTALLGRAGHGPTITRCDIGGVTLLPSGDCVLRYKLSLEQPGGERAELLVGARLLTGQLECALYMRDRIAPLVMLHRGHPALRLLRTPAAMIEPLNMVVYAFPIDGDLPTLAAATDPARVAELLGEALGAGPAAAQDGAGPAVEVVEYARQGRCTLRYRLDGRTIYGKVYGESLGTANAAAWSALHRHALADGRFRVPASLGWRPNLKLALLEAIPGEPLVAAALVARLHGRPGPGGRAIEELVEHAGELAAWLHGSGIRLGQRRSLDDELAALRRELSALRRFSPDLAQRLDAALLQLAGYAEQSDPLPLGLAHGDFTHGQLLFAGPSVGLIDLDNLCQAEPALDLAQFLAYLRIAARKCDPAEAAVVLDELGERFLDAYGAAAGGRLDDPQRLRVRVAIYRVASLIRRATRSWQKCKGGRAGHALALLEEELACLQQLDY